ncbi:MAG: AsmA family protein, partial [Chloroflexota bacterium]
MRKRIVLAGCAALAGVLILLLLSANSLVERNKAFLIGRAEQAFGRKLSVGQIRITFWPIGARLQDFALADDPAFSAEDFVRAKEFRIELRLLPLFSGEIRPKRMMLESPMITLVRDASGRYNFASRNRREKPGRDGTDSGAKRSTEWDIEQLFLLPAFALADGTLRYRDLAGRELVISRINLKAGDFEPDQPFAIELEAAVNAA